MRHALIDSLSVGKARYTLRKLLSRTDRSEYLRGLRAGRLTQQYLPRAVAGETNVFQRRLEKDGVNTYVSVAIDSSSSMGYYERDKAAQRLACTLSAALSGCVGVKHDVLGWTSGRLHLATHSQFRAKRVKEINDGKDDHRTVIGENRGDPSRGLGDSTLTYLKTDRQTTGHLCSVFAENPHILACGATPAFASLAATVRQVRSKRSFERKVIMFLTDGAVNDGGERRLMHRLCEEVLRDGIIVIGVGVQANAAGCFPPDSYLTVMDPADLGGKAMTKLVERIAKAA
jgi:hypothetical protein